MRLHNMTYLVKEGAKNIVHNKLMSFACVGVLVACLLLIGAAALFSLNINSIVSFVEEQNEVVAFLDDSLTASDVEVVELTLRNISNIAAIDYVSKADALVSQREKLGEYASLFDGLEDSNPLPNKFVLQVADLALLDDTTARVREIDGVSQVNAPTEVAAILVGVRQVVTVAGSSIVLILVVVSIVIITNTIKITVFSRRREINIMKYVGATDSFIRMPFLAEGMLIGLIAAVTAFLLLGMGYTYLLRWIVDNYSLSVGNAGSILSRAIDFWSIAHWVFGAFAVLGIFIGTMGSGLFVRKHLKV